MDYVLFVVYFSESRTEPDTQGTLDGHLLSEGASRKEVYILSVLFADLCPSLLGWL